MEDFLRTNHHRTLRMGRWTPSWNRALSQIARNVSPGSYLNVNDSTPVLTSNSITMSNKHGVSSEDLVVMQAH